MGEGEGGVGGRMRGGGRLLRAQSTSSVELVLRPRGDSGGCPMRGWRADQGGVSGSTHTPIPTHIHHRSTNLIAFMFVTSPPSFLDTCNATIV